MTQEFVVARKVFTLTWTGVALGATVGAIVTLGGYAQREIRRRGYPTWENCHCDFKSQESVFQVLHSRHEQRGETVFAEEWGLTLTYIPQWLRRLLHHSSQVCATLNPKGNYVERVSLTPQEADKLASLLFASTSSEDTLPETGSQIVWRREVLYSPKHLFDKNIRRLYPAHVPYERASTVEPLAALWDPQSNLPLPNEGALLNTPTGTRIDCIGWAPTQISYCTKRVKN